MFYNNRLLIVVSLVLALTLSGCMNSAAKYAPQLSNPSSCDQQPTQAERLACFEYVSSQHNKPEYCEFYSGKKLDCYYRVASKMNRPDICERLTNPTDVFACKSMITADTSIDVLSDFFGEKDPVCLDSCIQKQRQCDAAADSAYNDELERCASIEAIGANPDVPAQTGPCEVQAREHWRSGIDACVNEKHACDGGC